jgi:hypothetical protein
VKVVISLNDRKLKHYLKECRDDCQYIPLGEKKEDISQLLDKKHFKEIKTDDYDDMFKDKFVEDYIDLIGQLGLKYNSIYWWVTGTSAKNQFASKFFENLFIFYVTVDKLIELERDRKTDILIINPPLEIVSSIEKYCHANSINLKILFSPVKNVFEVAKRKLTSYLVILFFIYQTWRKIYLSNKYLKKNLSKVQRNKEHYVLRTWLYSKSINENKEYQDSFFGILPDYLSKMGKRVLVIVGIWGDYHSIVKKIAQHNKHLIIPQELFISYMDPIKAVIDIYLNRQKIREKIDFNGLNVSDIASKEINKEFNGRGLLNILRDYLHQYYIKRLTDKIKIETFTTTYENYPWEKMCFLALKKYSPETKIIGYQHAPLSNGSLSMRLSKYEKDIIPLPDKIVTVGRVTKRFLEDIGNYEKNKVKAGCALRFERHAISKIGQKGSSYRILLVLGGILTRTRDILNFVYRALKNNKQYRIVIRPHPALPPDRFKHSLDFNLASCDNFSLSINSSIEKNLQEADIVLYDASAVSIEALMHGVPVIHIGLNDILSFDPLFQCKYFKWDVKKEEEFQKTLDNVYQLSDEEYHTQQKKARTYAENYAHAVTDVRLNEFI